VDFFLAEAFVGMIVAFFEVFVLRAMLYFLLKVQF